MCVTVLCLGASLLVFLLHGFLDYFLEFTAIYVLFWTLIGLLVSKATRGQEPLQRSVRPGMRLSPHRSTTGVFERAPFGALMLVALTFALEVHVRGVAGPACENIANLARELLGPPRWEDRTAEYRFDRRCARECGLSFSSEDYRCNTSM